ncbi:hypothetical protein DES53_11049 [Roseimicrobium gellanilyticum]|uniref:Uncharacterized protein n=1 Tax=Roseimicrobium gellanilyticum TaxID=748857 RepID=A0A366HA22_9BACT|nr:hypothetical protein [Roseimicrobium gellanilyticum]RBP39026.1 hypothetical protein DES53_11049 [Roseimicrobium gellanilyticum]
MPAETSKESPLIFHWPRPLEQGKRLIFWIGVVALGLAGFFYVFQVVYPQSQRSTPIPHQVLLLDPSDPIARAILNKVQDRDFLVLPSDDPGANAARLEDHAPVFHPSYEGHQLGLQDLPHKPFTVPPARLLKVDEPVLPPLDLSGLKRPVEDAMPTSKESAPRLVVKLTGALATRKMIHPPDLAGLAPADPGAHHIQLGVDAHGRVWFALPLRESENLVASAELTERLTRTRFEPVTVKKESAETPTWGVATFAWETPVGP